MISRTTEFDARGYWETLKQIYSLPPTFLTAQENDLKYLQDKLKQAEEPVTEASWEDTLASWQALMALLPKMKSKRGIAVLEAIFSDRQVLKAMGAGKQFNVANVGEGKLPAEVLKLLKTGLGGHIKAHAYEYDQMIGRELARIARIKQLQARAVGLVATAITAGLIGVANFVSKVVYEIVYPAGFP